MHVFDLLYLWLIVRPQYSVVCADLGYVFMIVMIRLVVWIDVLVL